MSDLKYISADINYKGFFHCYSFFLPIRIIFKYGLSLTLDHETGYITG
jgi:hypothetical protein